MTIEIGGKLFPNGMTLFVQLLSTFVLIGLLYGIYILIFRLPAQLRDMEHRIDHIESQLNREKQRRL